MPVPRHPKRRASSTALATLCLASTIAGSVLGWLSLRAWPASHDPAPSPFLAGNVTAPDVTGSSSEADAPTHLHVSPWPDRWEETIAQPSTPARTRALAALLEELARSDPQRALGLAQNHADWRLREILRDASLRGWASASPAAAADWALGVRIEDRRAAIGAVFQGASADPDATVQLALRVCAADPAPAGDYGHAAIAALVDAGAFAQAADFGSSMDSGKYNFLFESAFFQWARQRPAEALAAAEKIADPQRAAHARAQAVAGWAWADAAGLAKHALAMPPGSERSRALAEALPLWLERNPAEAATWIQNNDTGSEFDSGLAALANQQSLLKSSPAAALDLASDIADPTTRTETMRSVFQQWATRDPLAARAYLDRSGNAADRAALTALLAELTPHAIP